MLTRTRTILTCTAAAAAAGLAAGSAAPALAAARPAPSTAGTGWTLRLTHHDRATGRTAAATTSTRTFAGYQTTVATGSATTSVASFTVPVLSCTAADRAIAPFAGVVVRDYKSDSIAFVFTGCVNGTATYYPGLVVNGAVTNYRKSPLAAGDVIDLTTKVSVNRTRAQVTDVTTGVTQKIIGAGGRARAAWIGDDGFSTSTGQEVHVPDFGKLTLKNCLVDGKALASWHPHGYQRVNSRGTVQIATGAFWPGGNTFTTRFEHS
jgi:hypothetical protein